jgi:hypothetical protein
MLDELRVALERNGKLLFFTGYRHYGSIGRPDQEIQEELEFQERITRSHGFFWEDAFRAVTAPDEVGASSFERYKRHRDFAVSRGKYLVNLVNTHIDNQPTSHEQERRLARFHLAGFLAAMSGPLTVMLHYTPTAGATQFGSTAFFKEWDLAIGNPVGANTQPIPRVAVYLREFQNARVVFNTSSVPYTVDLSDGVYTNTNGQVQGSSAVVQPKTGEIFTRAPLACDPRPPVQVRVTSLDGGTIQADLTAGSSAGNLRSLRVVGVQNASVDVEGGPSGQTGAFTHQITSGAKTVRLIVRKTGPTASTVRLIVTDGCGEWPTFVGAGSGVS